MCALLSRFSCVHLFAWLPRILTLPVITEYRAELSALYSNFPLPILHKVGCVYFFLVDRGQEAWT